MRVIVAAYSGAAVIINAVSSLHLSNKEPRFLACTISANINVSVSFARKQRMASKP